MTGKVVKISQAERDKLRAEYHADREQYEWQTVNQGSGFELIYPNIYNDEKQAENEMLVKKSQQVWDDFTTGKNKGQGKEKKGKTPKKKKTEKAASQEDLDEVNDNVSVKSSSDDEVDKEEGTNEIRVGTNSSEGETQVKN